MVNYCMILHRASGIILVMSSAIEKQCYIVTASLIGWAHSQNNRCAIIKVEHRSYFNSQKTLHISCILSWFIHKSSIVITQYNMKLYIDMPIKKVEYIHVVCIWYFNRQWSHQISLWVSIGSILVEIIFVVFETLGIFLFLIVILSPC